MSSLETIGEILERIETRVGAIETALNNGIKMDLAVVKSDILRHRWWLRGLTGMLFGIAGYVIRSVMK